MLRTALACAYFECVSAVKRIHSNRMREDLATLASPRTLLTFFYRNLVNVLSPDIVLRLFPHNLDSEPSPFLSTVASVEQNSVPALPSDSASNCTWPLAIAVEQLPGQTWSSATGDATRSASLDTASGNFIGGRIHGRGPVILLLALKTQVFHTRIAQNSGSWWAMNTQQTLLKLLNQLSRRVDISVHLGLGCRAGGHSWTRGCLILWFCRADSIDNMCGKQLCTFHAAMSTFGRELRASCCSVSCCCGFVSAFSTFLG